MLKILNTLTRKKEDFKPIKTKKVGLYTCGPTVYNYAHIGNLRTYIFEDVVRRTLEYLGYEVKHVMNITDVGHLTGDRDMGEDKIERQARVQKKSAWDIADFFTKEFFNDIELLNILAPHVTDKATDTIEEQIQLINALETKGFTYITSDGVYFDTSKLSDYGKLANLDLENLKEGARVEKNEEKKNPTDFALWKFSPKAEQRQMEWESPWGIGFPGWHLECSAISTKHLGQPFDIHTGGIDHIPIHHTNEIAQSEAAYDKPLANYWLHGEFLIVDKTRMGKSEGNFLRIQTIIDKGITPLAYRYFVLNAHYRSALNLSWEALEGAQNALNNLYSRISEMGDVANEGVLEYEQKFQVALEDDFNTPQALAVMWDLIKSDNEGSAKKASLLKFDQVLGLKLDEVKKEEINIPAEVQTLVDERKQVRKDKDFAKSDELRDQILKHGFEVEDTDTGQKVKAKK